MAFALKILAGLAALYLLFVGALALGQTALLFPRWAMGGGTPLPAGSITLVLERPDGIMLHGHLLGDEHGTGPLILGFGGNAWDARAVATSLAAHLPGHDVAAFHYRGYGPSTGQPSAAALLEDAVAIHDLLAARAPDRPIIAVGISLGAGVAAHLAAARPLAGVVLVTPFDSLHALARAHHPWAPVGLLLRHRMEPASALAESGVPVAMITATRDHVVPASRSRALAAALEDVRPGLVFAREIDAGHDDIHGHPELRMALREAVARLRPEALP